MGERDKTGSRDHPCAKTVHEIYLEAFAGRGKEVHKMQFPEVEGEYLVKFALSQDGNLWLWNYGQGGLLGLFYIIYPTIGLFFGIIFVLLNRAGVFIWKVIKDR